MKTLADLSLGESAIIRGFSNTDIAQKLIEMQCIPGETVQMVKKAPFGDPMIINVSNYDLIIRKSEAQLILI